MKKFSIFELADEANKLQIDLGTNPVRTIRYYVSLGVLDKPRIIQTGKKRLSQFNEEHLFKLKIVDYYKKQGLTLEEIKKILNKHIFWSDFGLRYIKEHMADIYHPDLYNKTKPVTRETIAYFILKLMQNKELDGNIRHKITQKSIVDANGKPAVEIPLLDGGLTLGSENNNS